MPPPRSLAIVADAEGDARDGGAVAVGVAVEAVGEAEILRRRAWPAISRWRRVDAGVKDGMPTPGEPMV